MRVKNTKETGKKTVRTCFKGMVIGMASVFVLAGLSVNGLAFGDVEAAKAEAGKALSNTVDEAKSGVEKTASKLVSDAKADAQKVAEKAAEKATEAKDHTPIPEFVNINTQKMCPDMEGLKKDVKSVNNFSHASHIKMLKQETKGFVCATCHKGAKSEQDILKSDRCKRMEVELEEAGGPAKLKDYFHSTCLKCHKELKKQGKDTGPVSCKGCHNRKEGDK